MSFVGLGFRAWEIGLGFCLSDLFPLADEIPMQRFGGLGFRVHVGGGGWGGGSGKTRQSLGVFKLRESPL